MSTLDEVTAALKSLRATAEKELAFAAWAESKLLPVVAKLSENTKFDLNCAIPWIHVYNREDLTQLMTLAPRWEKTKANSTINYSATIDGYRFTLFANSGALPPTCKVVKTVKIVPATEAREVEEETIVCELPTAEL